MNTHRSPYLLASTLGLAMFATAGCAEKEKTAGMTPSPTPAVSTQGVTAASNARAATTWAEIKDVTYDGRAAFLAGIAGIETEMDNQIVALNSKRTAMLSSTETKDWDLAMKELNDARSALKSSSEELRKATAETWSQAKDKVGQAVVRTQDAVAKVKTSTTS